MRNKNSSLQNAILLKKHFKKNTALSLYLEELMVAIRPRQAVVSLYVSDELSIVHINT